MIKTKKEIAEILQISKTTLSLYLYSNNIFEKYRVKGCRYKYEFNKDFLCALKMFCEKRLKYIWDNRVRAYTKCIDRVQELINDVSLIQ